MSVGHLEGEMRRCWMCSAVEHRVYVRAYNKGRQTFLAIGWICPACNSFTYEHDKLLYLAILSNGKKRRRCVCGAPMLRLYAKNLKTQRFTAVGWLCLRERWYMLDDADLTALVGKDA